MSEFLRRQKRYGQVLGLLAQHDMAWLLDRLGLTKLVPKEFQQPDEEGLHTGATQPERVRMLLEALGPTFVKMGQIMATRPDLIPQDYIHELRKLQDGAREVPFDAIRAVIEEELGAPLADLFDSVEETPLAAASIGQVHRVTMTDGREAVLKVQRPGIEETIRMDLAILHSFAELADRTGVMPSISARAITREFELAILRELDFIIEGQETERFSEQHADEPRLKIPEIYWSHTRKRVMALELIEGVKVSDVDAIQAQGHDPNALASLLVGTILSQLLVHGRFHADPHPGNLLVMPDGRLAMIDFGMSGHLDRHTRRALLDLAQSATQRDHRRTADLLLQHDLISHDVDMRALREELRGLFRLLDAGGDAAQVSEALIQFVVRHELAFPPDLFFLDKVFGTLDGTLKRLDPSLQMRNLASDYLPTLLREQIASLDVYAKELLAHLIEIDQTLLAIPGATLKLLQRLDASRLKHYPTHSLSPRGERQLARLIARALVATLGVLLIVVGALTSVPRANLGAPIVLAGTILAIIGLAALWLSGGEE